MRTALASIAAKAALWGGLLLAGAPALAVLVNLAPAYAYPHLTIQVLDVDSLGNPANGDASHCAISGDGSVVAFDSQANNLGNREGSDFSSNWDVFYHRVGSGQGAKLVSRQVNLPYDASANGDSRDPDISGDGTQVFFSSDATDLVFDYTGEKGPIQIYRTSLDNNMEPRLVSDPFDPQADCRKPSTDATGELCLYVFDPQDSSQPGQIRLWNQNYSRYTQVSPVGSRATANKHCYDPDLSANGRYAAYASNATNLASGVEGANGYTSHIYGADLEEKVNALYTQTWQGGGQAACSGSTLASMANSGHCVFQSSAHDLVEGLDYIIHIAAVFLSQKMGGSDANELISQDHDGNLCAGYGPSIASANPNWVAYYSDDGHLHDQIRPNVYQAVIRDRENQINRVVSRAENDAQTMANAAVTQVALSADGRYLAFISAATNLAPGVNNGFKHVYRVGPLY